MALAAIASTAPVAAAGALADGRVYEMASPPAKNGGEVMGDSTRVRASSVEDATHSMAVTFGSLAGFADVRGSGVAVEYLSQRDGRPGTNGWTTHAITPPQDPLSLVGAFQGQDPLYEGDFSEDLSSGVFRAWSPVTDAPDVAAVENLYLRRDLRAPGAGFYTLLSTCPFCISAGALPRDLEKPRIAAASTDFNRILFESKHRLTSDASSSGRPNLYVWSPENGVELAGILPDGTAATSSIAGQGATSLHYTTNTMSRDGARVFFTTPTTGDGRPNAQSGPNASKIYMRDLATSTTVQVNASERTLQDTPSAATFWTASTDGSRAFLTSQEALTNDVTTNAQHLYSWDANAAAGSRLRMVDVDGNPGDPPGGVSGVIGASADGHFVYFVASGQLDPSGPVLGAGRGIYLWHDGDVSYIGGLTFAGGDLPQNVNNNWSFTPIQARVSDDGKHVLFAASSGEGLTGVDQSSDCSSGPTCIELYVYSAGTHHLVCASCQTNGDPATSSAFDHVQQKGTGAALGSWHESHAMTEDGSEAFFSTAERLVPEDTNGKFDAYEYSVTAGTVHLLSSGVDKSDSYFMDASPDGRDVFFITRAALVGWDTDRSYDLYDARRGGGFPEPAVTIAACANDACQGSPAAPPPALSFGSQLFSGHGDPPLKITPARKAKTKPIPKRVRCRKGLVTKRAHGKIRCVRKARRAPKRSARSSARRMAR